MAGTTGVTSGLQATRPPALFNPYDQVKQYDPNTGAYTGLKTVKEINPLYSQAYDLAGGMMSGSAFSPYRQSMNQALQRSATNLRNTQGAFNAPRIGQGSAVRAQQGTEQAINAGVADTQLQMAQQEQAMKERGVDVYSGLVRDQFNQNQQDINSNQWQQQFNAGRADSALEHASLYGSDQDVIAAYKNAYGTDLDPASVTQYRDYMRQKQAQDLRSGEQNINIARDNFYGYDKTNPDGTVTHISGTGEIASGTYNQALQTFNSQKTSQAGSDMQGYFASRSNVAGYDWRNDPGASSYLQRYWESLGKTGNFDQDWADQQVQASTIGAVDASINKVTSSSWFKSLDPTTQGNVRGLLQTASILSVTQGVQGIFDDKGNIIGLKDSKGNTLGMMPGYTAPSTESTADAFSGLQTSMDQFGETPTATVADSIKRLIGHYPSRDEYNQYSGIAKAISSGNLIKSDGTLAVSSGDLSALNSLVLSNQLPSTLKSNINLQDVNFVSLFTDFNDTQVSDYGRRFLEENRGKVFVLPNGDSMILTNVGRKGPHSGEMSFIKLKDGSSVTWPISVTVTRVK